MIEYRPIIRPSTLRLMRRVKVAWPLGLCACLAIGYVAYFAYWTPFAAHYWIQSPVHRFGREARQLGLTYETVVRNPEAARGKPVLWHVTHHGSGSWHYRGHPGHPIQWSGREPDLTVTGQSGSANSHRIVAIVIEADERGVVLNYVERG